MIEHDEVYIQASHGFRPQTNFPLVAILSLNAPVSTLQNIGENVFVWNNLQYNQAQKISQKDLKINTEIWDTPQNSHDWEAVVIHTQ